MRGRVLILTGEPPDYPGGVEHFVREVARGLENRGYVTEVFHRRNSVPVWLQSPQGKVGRYISGNLLGYFIARNARKRVDLDVVAVISNGDQGWCAPKPSSKIGKRIHMYHGTYRGQAEMIRPFISYRGYLYLKWWCSEILERLGGRNRIVLSNSEQTQQEVRRFFGWDGEVVWLPLDLDTFRCRDPRECRRLLGVSEDKPRGLFVGSTNPAKGFGTVRRLTEGLPEVQWTLVLSGEVPRDLEAIPNVNVLRGISEGNLPVVYAAADFLICPSYYESFGYVVAEALACGTPVVASPGGASRAFLKDPPLDRLLIQDPASVDLFAAAVREVLRVPEFFRQKVLELARPRLVELMSPENWWRRFGEVTGL